MGNAALPLTLNAVDNLCIATATMPIFFVGSPVVFATMTGEITTATGVIGHTAASSTALGAARATRGLPSSARNFLEASLLSWALSQLVAGANRAGKADKAENLFVTKRHCER